MFPTCGKHILHLSIANRLSAISANDKLPLIALLALSAIDGNSAVHNISANEKRINVEIANSAYHKRWSALVSTISAIEKALISAYQL